MDMNIGIRDIDFAQYASKISLLVNNDWVRAVMKLRSAGEILSQEDICRWDNIAWHLYQDVDYWYLLAIYNGVKSLAVLKPGVVIRFPFKADLDSLRSEIIAQQLSLDAGDRTEALENWVVRVLNAQN